MLLTKGFTLVELLVVVAIIGVLTTVGFVSYQNIRDKAQDSKKKTEIDSIKKAYETKFIANGQTVYLPLLPADFADNRIPTQPNGSPYPCLIGPDANCSYNPNNYPAANQSYQISTILSDGSTYKATADQGNLDLSTICTKLIPMQSCNVWSVVPYSRVPEGGIIYLNCSDIPSNIDCSGPDTGQSWRVTTYYTQKNGGTGYSMTAYNQSKTIYQLSHQDGGFRTPVHIDLHMPQ